MRLKKGILLFEVVFVVLVVAIISLFLFRSYGTFSKAARKNLDFFKLMALTEEKLWDLQAQEAVDGKLPLDMEKSASFESCPFSWYLELEDAGYAGLKQARVSISRNNRQAAALDTVLFLGFEEL